jgi:thymidylate synthase (FAD)
MKNQLAAMTEQTLNQCEETYQTMLRLGVAKETARRILPLCTKTTLYMNGTLRSWIHYLELRTDKATQLEHRVIAEEIKQIFQEEFPVIANVIFN